GSASAPFLRQVVGDAAARGAAVTTRSIRQALLAADAATRRALFAEFVAATVAGVLRLPVEELDTTAPLQSFGLDSLMALEIRNRLQDAAGGRLPWSGDADPGRRPSRPSAAFGRERRRAAAADARRPLIFAAFLGA